MSSVTTKKLQKLTKLHSFQILYYRIKKPLCNIFQEKVFESSGASSACGAFPFWFKLVRSGRTHPTVSAFEMGQPLYGCKGEQLFGIVAKRSFCS